MKSVEGLDQFEPWELEMFADGYDIPHINAFVSQNPDLWKAWLKDYRREQRAYSILHRFDCPSPDELRDYYWSVLSAGYLVQIATHLDVCATCSQELDSLDESMAIEENIESLHAIENQDPSPLVSQMLNRVSEIAERVKWTVATLAAPSASMFVPAELRSDDVGLPGSSARPSTWFYETDDVDVNLVMQREVEGLITLSGHILADKPFVDGRVKITSDESHVQPIQALVNDVGEFTLPKLSLGTYHLVVTIPENVIVVPNLVLK